MKSFPENPVATIRQAVILAGGRGGRLGALTDATPKPLLDVGGRPFLAWLILELCRFGVEDVLLLTGYLGDAIEAALPEIGATLPRPMTMRCRREPAPAGTGGALRLAAAALDTRILLLNGDSWLDFNLSRLLADSAGGPVSEIGRMVLRQVADTGRFGVVECEGGRVTAFPERPQMPGPGLINAGIYLFSRAVVDEIPPAASLERDVLPGLAARGALHCTVADGYFIDIGVPEDLARARAEMPARLQRRVAAEVKVSG
jgi:D-glycero-D-manno-heptose 1,7-bisphosphate phosphatase